MILDFTVLPGFARFCLLKIIAKKPLKTGDGEESKQQFLFRESLTEVVQEKFNELGKHKLRNTVVAHSNILGSKADIRNNFVKQNVA